MEACYTTGRRLCTDLGGVHDLLPNVDLPKGLEQRQNGQVEALPGALPIALLMEPAIYNWQQAKHAHSQIAICCFLEGIARLSEKHARLAKAMGPPLNFLVCAAGDTACQRWQGYRQSDCHFYLSPILQQLSLCQFRPAARLALHVLRQ